MAKAGTSHEDYTRSSKVKRGSDRAFGFVFAAVFLIVGLLPVLDGGAPRLWSLAVAGAFLLVALVVPRVLSPLNKVWFKFGLFLHHVVNPIIMGIVFFIAVVPTGLIMRAVGKDPLHLQREPNAKSYWIMREPPGPAPESLKNQF